MLNLASAKPCPLCLLTFLTWDATPLTREEESKNKTGLCKSPYLFLWKIPETWFLQQETHSFCSKWKINGAARNFLVRVHSRAHAHNHNCPNKCVAFLHSFLLQTTLFFFWVKLTDAAGVIIYCQALLLPSRSLEAVQPGSFSNREMSLFVGKESLRKQREAILKVK